MQPDGSEIHTCPTSDSFGGKPAVPYSIDTCESEAELLGIEADWNRLSETAAFPNVFTTFGWFRIWTLQFINEDQRHRLQPYVLVLRQDGKVTGIAPFMRVVSSQFGLRLRKLEFVTNYADYNELVLGAEPADQTRAVIDFLARRNKEWDIVDLRQLHATPEGIRRIEGALRLAGLAHRLFSERAMPVYDDRRAIFQDPESPVASNARHVPKDAIASGRDGRRGFACSYCRAAA